MKFLILFIIFAIIILIFKFTKKKKIKIKQKKFTDNKVNTEKVIDLEIDPKTKEYKPKD